MSLLHKISIYSAIVGLIAFIIGCILGFKVLPDIIDNEIKKTVVLQIPDQYKNWKDTPYSLDFKIYLFEVTNLWSVLNGSEPAVQEVGPIVFKKYIRKEDIYFHEDTKTYDYNLISNISTDIGSLKLFNKNITVFNAAVYNLLQHFEKRRDLSIFIKQANLAFGEFDNLLFHEINIGDFLLNGYKFCNSIPESELCSKIRLQIEDLPSFRLNADNSIVFSVFDYKIFQHSDGPYNVDSGIINVKLTGKIYKYKDNDYLNIWNGSKSTCNEIKGTDSYIFSPFSEWKTNLFIFAPFICRSIELEFHEEIVYKTIPGHRYIIKPDTFASADNYPENECYCIEQIRPLYGEKCFPDGFIDLQSCDQFPFVGSFPHLLWADETYRNTVVNLQPDINKHAFFVDLEPNTGTPLSSASRIQYNMMFRSFGDIPILNKIKAAVMPVFWVEESFQLPDDLIKTLQSNYFDMLPTVDGLHWGFTGCGLVLMFLGVTVYLSIQHDSRR